MKTKVYLRKRLLLLDGANGIVDLLVATVIGDARLFFAVHGERFVRVFGSSVSSARGFGGGKSEELTLFAC